jgi:hypothetical protein
MVMQMKKNDDFKKKWRNRILTPENIDEYIDDLRKHKKSRYVTLGVSFNKEDNFQMNLLKQALLTHKSFSVFIKHLLAMYFHQQQQQQMFMMQQQNQMGNTMMNNFNNFGMQQPFTYFPAQNVNFAPMQESFDFENEEEEEEDINEQEQDYEEEQEEYDEEQEIKPNKVANVKKSILADKPKVDTSKRITPKTNIRARGNLDLFLQSNPNAKSPNE